MANWASTELRRLRNLHADGQRPTLVELEKHFPRHPVLSVAEIARRMGLRRPWNYADAARLEKARAYLAGRGAAVQAYLGISVPEAAE